MTRTMTRSVMTMLLAVGAGVGTAAANPAPTPAPAPTTPGGFACQNKLSIQAVSCVGSIAVLPITVNVANVGVLNDSDLNVLSGDLDNLSIKDIDILDYNTILDDVKLTVLQDFLGKIGVDITKNDVDVCATVLGALLCK
jgi:hypothetical protein